MVVTPTSVAAFLLSTDQLDLCFNAHLEALQTALVIGFSTLPLLVGRVAQLVEQRTENPCVGGSTPPPTT